MGSPLVGAGPGDGASGVRPEQGHPVDPHGIEYDPSPKHAKIITKSTEVEHARSARAPGARRTQGPQDEQPLFREEATRYRAVVARLNYLALDRPDLQFASKTLSKGMADPRSEIGSR